MVRRTCGEIGQGFFCESAVAPAGSEGFTLVEVMVALVIFSIGLLGVASMQINAIQGNARANKMSEASIIASERADILLDLDFGSSKLVDGAASGDGYTVNWVVTSPSTTTRDITVSVAWRDGLKQHGFDYRFLKVKNM